MLSRDSVLARDWRAEPVRLPTMQRRSERRLPLIDFCRFLPKPKTFPSDRVSHSTRPKNPPVRINHNRSQKSQGSPRAAQALMPQGPHEDQHLALASTTRPASARAHGKYVPCLAMHDETFPNNLLLSNKSCDGSTRCAAPPADQAQICVLRQECQHLSANAARVLTTKENITRACFTNYSLCQGQFSFVYNYALWCRDIGVTLYPERTSFFG